MKEINITSAYKAWLKWKNFPGGIGNIDEKLKAAGEATDKVEEILKAIAPINGKARERIFDHKACLDLFNVIDTRFSKFTNQEKEGCKFRMLSHHSTFSSAYKKASHGQHPLSTLVSVEFGKAGKIVIYSAMRDYCDVKYPLEIFYSAMAADKLEELLTAGVVY